MKRILLITLSIIAVSLGFNTGSVFADEPVSDYSVTIDSSFDGTPITLCNSERPCSNYRYVSVDVSGVTTDNTYRYVSVLSFNVRAYFYNETYAIYEIPSGTYSNATVAFNGYANFFPSFPNAIIKVTLSQSIPGSSPIPCPEPQDPNRSPVMDDFHNVFINTMLSIIPITAIIFVVWFFIDMLSSLVFGRGK